jgi:hypothetical protein
MRMSWAQWLASFWRPRAAPPGKARRPVTRRPLVAWLLVWRGPAPLPDWCTPAGRCRARTRSEARARFKALLTLPRRARLPLGFAAVAA